jgi:hypothetical protein
MLILCGRSRRITPFFLAALLVPVMSAVQPSGLLAAQLPQPPALKWVKGKITQILVQPRENFYTFMLRDTNGATTLVRLCDPYTGKATPVKADDPAYDLLRESFFRGREVQAGVRDFGEDPQSGTKKICLDRVSLSR